MRIDELTQQPGQMEILQRDAIFEMLRVAMPGTIVNYDATKRTATVQPGIRDWKRSEKPPLLLDVPVYFLGKYTVNVSTGDECLVVFADTSIDGWFEQGGVASPVSARRHDLSDGFAFVGFRSKANARPSVNLETLLDSIQDYTFFQNMTWGDLEGGEEA